MLPGGLLGLPVVELGSWFVGLDEACPLTPVGIPAENNPLQYPRGKPLVSPIGSSVCAGCCLIDLCAAQPPWLWSAGLLARFSEALKHRRWKDSSLLGAENKGVDKPDTDW